MKNVITFMRTIIKIVIFSSLLLSPATVLAGGDSMGGRPEYTIDQINNGDLGDTITFNSIKDSVIGHEFDFVDAREDTGINLGEKNKWYGGNITVEDGRYYFVRMYVHNNNPHGYNAIAENVHVAFGIPGDTGYQVQVHGFINSSNATPDEYWDGVNFNSDHPFHLEYVTNSARLFNNSVGNVSDSEGRSGIHISDDLVFNPDGIKIGYDTIDDGRIPGCYQFDNFVVILVKAVYDYEYSIETLVRPAGTKDDNWTKNLQANIGDRLEYQIEYENTSDETQNDVALRDILPKNVEYIPGTTRLWNEFHDGDTIDQDDLVTNGITIGSYDPGANAYIRFNAIVVDKNLDEGSNTLINWGQGWVGETLKEDYTGIVLYKDSKLTTTIMMLAFLIMTCLLVIAALLQKTYKNRHL